MQEKRKNRINREKLYLNKGQINLAFLKQAFTSGQTLQLDLLDEIITKFTGIVKLQPNLIKLTDPVAVIGDIHGQLWDFIKLLSLIPSLQDKKTKYLFLGDYVDRGINGCEVSILLYCMKINYPKQIFMLRGNHQSRIMTQMNNFLAQFCQKYHFPLFEKMMESFDALPFAAIINDKYFCVHGGISLEIMNYNPIDKLNTIDRFQQIRHQGLMCDVYWADPVDSPQGKMNSIVEKNDSRGCSVYFGAELTKKFLKQNNLLMVIRAHEILNLQGFKQYIWQQQTNQPLVLTIFSAPNYCGSYQNRAVVLTIEQSKMKLRQFHENTLKLQINPNYDAINVTFQKIMKTALSFMKYSTEAIVNSKFSDFKNVRKLPKQQKIKMLLAAKQIIDKQRAIDKPKHLIVPKIKSDITKDIMQRKQLLLESLSLIKVDSAIRVQSFDGQQLKNMTEQKSKAFKRSQQFYKQKQMLPKKNKIIKESQDQDNF